MSVGHLCEHCGQGRVRPFQFSIEQAVVTCDNVECGSRLEISPWDCVVNRNIRQNPNQSLYQERLHLASRNSCSNSSGFQSDIRSPLPSPAPSCDSVSDREVENLLRKYSDTPKNKTTDKVPTKPSTYNDKTAESNSYASFFELLDGLDLDAQHQSSTKLENQSKSQTSIKSFDPDPVALELESWMQSFKSPMTSIKKEPNAGEEKEVQQGMSLETVGSTERNVATSSDRLNIPSNSSTISKVTFENDSSCSSTNVDATGKTKSYKSSGIFFDKPFDVSKIDTSVCDTRFLFPAASAVSDDSGCEDTGIKSHLMLFPPPLHGKSSDAASCVLSSPAKDTLKKQNSSSSVTLSDVNITSNKETAISPSIEVGLPTTVLPENSLELVDHKSTNMTISKEACEPVEKSTFVSPLRPEENLAGADTSTKSFESSQPDGFVPAPTPPSTSTQPSTLLSTSEHENEKKPYPYLGGESKTRDSSKLNRKCKEMTANTVETKVNKKRGRPRGGLKPEITDLSQLKRPNKRRKEAAIKEEEKPEIESASLRKGLASLLHAPTLRIKKEGNHHNLTSLGFRSRFNVKYSFRL